MADPMSVAEFIALRPGVPVVELKTGAVGVAISKPSGDGPVVAFGASADDCLSAHYKAFGLLGPCVLRWDGRQWLQLPERRRTRKLWWRTITARRSHSPGA